MSNGWTDFEQVEVESTLNARACSWNPALQTAIYYAFGEYCLGTVPRDVWYSTLEAAKLAAELIGSDRT